MDGTVEDASRGKQPDRTSRLLVTVLVFAVVLNLWNFIVEQSGQRRLRARRAMDLEAMAVSSPSRAVRERHGTYYQLARALHGVTLTMDEQMAARHRWALEGLTGADIRLSARPLVQISQANAQPIIDAATFRGTLERHPLDLVADPAVRDYVMSWIGKGDKARILIAPRARFLAAKGKL